MSRVKIQLEVDLRVIRRAFALIGQDIPSDERILSKMGQEPTLINLRVYGDEAEAAEMGLTITAIAKAFNLDV